jgi:tropomyosin
LEEEVENAHDKIKELKGTEDEGNDYKTELENSMRKISLLEQDLEDSEKSLKETTTK